MAWKRWITLWRMLAVFAIALIWIGSLWPVSELRQFDLSWFNDKVGHFLGYFTVALLLALGWRQSPPWLLWLIATLSGGLAELDLAANGGGALIGIVVGVSWCRLVAPSGR